MNKFYSTLRSGVYALCTVSFLALMSPAHAVTLNVVGGELQGASGVIVNGNVFDVEFIDGSCVSLFGGCDASSDFAFSNILDAIAAAQALLDTVLVDGPQGQFDTDPALTRGISDTRLGKLFIPYGLSGPSFLFARANNNSDNGFNDTVTATLIAALVTDNSIALPNVAFARFSTTIITDPPPSVVPLPSAGYLFVTGLIGLAALRRRAKKLAHA